MRSCLAACLSQVGSICVCLEGLVFKSLMMHLSCIQALNKEKAVKAAKATQQAATPGPGTAGGCWSEWRKQGASQRAEQAHATVVEALMGARDCVSVMPSE